ncbi:heme/hemin ABC transporter substrate-binding protein [Deinococcus aquatilis]|uniref:heme/hemin ABC transporter substrate-binding protein n=1 Tax=Deinococcus aquatilis TaxID=519440 RepID=UPI0003721D76|nr:hemin ABC transporter substrate-binding protein [Deinococcus aquatilis]
MKKSIVSLALLLSAAQAQTTVTGADGQPFVVQDTSRVITLGGPVTEIVFALGAGAKVIAADTSSYYPAAVTRLPKIGYQRALTAEGIISLKPTLVIATTEAGPPTTLAQLRAAGINILILPVEYTPQGTKTKISTIARIFGKESKAAELNAGIDRDLVKASLLTARFKSQPKVMFIYARGAQSVQISGSETAADAMIRLAGGVNPLGSVQGYKPLTAEAAVAAAPDVVLMLSGGMESVGGKAGLLKLPGLGQTPAAKNGRIVALDDLYLLGFGPRLGRAVQDLTLQLHPELEGK